jgi:hypothetical protein
MKKILPYAFGVIGLALVGYSLISPWTSWTQKFGAGISVITLGHEYWQGLVAGGLGLVALILLFVKPKFSILAGLAGAGVAMMVYISPPVEEQEPTKAIFFAAGGLILIGLGGLLAPSKKA